MSARVCFLVTPGYRLLDLSGPLTAFELANQCAGTAAYTISVASAMGGMVETSGGLRTETVRFEPRACDTLIVPGGTIERLIGGPEARLLAEAQPHTHRIASVCTGAFALAAAGVLDGRRATTHWNHAAQLQRMFPKIRVDGDRIHIRDGTIWTSAGISAGIDLALALIDSDLGEAIAQATAAFMVVNHRRHGGQSQFAGGMASAPRTDRIRRALAFARAHLGEPLPVDRLAEAASLSPRQFARVFQNETGETPAKAIERLRADLARGRIETSAEPIEAIALAVGFRDPETMRRAFIRRYGHPPQTFRRRR